MKKINSRILIEGIIEYINSYIIPNIEDNFLKVMLKACVVSAATKMDAYEKIIKEIIKNSFIQNIFEVEGDEFDIELLVNSLSEAMKECGDLKFTFPPVKFVSPEEKILTFTSNDLADFKQILIKFAGSEKK